MEIRTELKREETIPEDIEIAGRGIQINKSLRNFEIHPAVMDILRFMMKDFKDWDNVSFLIKAYWKKMSWAM